MYNKKMIFNYLIYVLLVFVILSFFLNNNTLYNYEFFTNPDDTSLITQPSNYLSFPSQIDIIYYINLDHRQDRNKLFLNEMDKMEIPKNIIERISGIYNKHHGGIGCTYSHIYTLQKFINSNHKIAIIFEDDFEFTVSKNVFLKQMNNIFSNNIDFDVICLAGNVIAAQNTVYPFLKKIVDSQTSAAYIITKEYAHTHLLNNFKEGLEELEKDYSKYPIYALDQYWKVLQRKHKWYITNPKLGKQRYSYSDIEKHIVNYLL